MVKQIRLLKKVINFSENLIEITNEINASGYQYTQRRARYLEKLEKTPPRIRSGKLLEGKFGSTTNMAQKVLENIGNYKFFLEKNIK